MRRISFLIALLCIVGMSLQIQDEVSAEHAAYAHAKVVSQSDRDANGTFAPWVNASAEAGPNPQDQDARPSTDSNAPSDLPEAKVVPLSADDSVGVIDDVEGAVLVMEATDSRWRPARKGQRLAINAMVKTGSRGAHASTVSLHRGRQVILGPGAQVALRGDGVVRVMSGEVEVSGTNDSAVTVEGPGESSHVVRTSKSFRAEDMRMVELTAIPKWLSSFKERSVSESLGSLLAMVDGRPVALSLGYHRVTVDIRDQIARTVIEESFINHTKDVLEGEFVFPLPADASISGFAMWIGGELIEADVVEKERARAIYEQLMKEKRDPGLLEWTSANLFKARVYPIHREKRIRIVYTQVLPKTGDEYSYQYALRSELLRARPLDELSIDVRVWSDRPLANVASTTHPSRVAQTQHAARIQFSANQYAPDRDFEATFKTATPIDKPVSLVTHTRGQDGYFMLQVDSPKRAQSRDERSRKPLDMIVVADTSGSMAGHARTIQRAALDALLDSLGPDDRFNLVLADLDVSRAFPSSVAPTTDTLSRARQHLDERAAMGWTDLGRAFRDLLPSVGRDTHVVYLGDGIPTTGDSDPAKLVSLLRDSHKQGSVHAIGCGNAYESMVLNGMALLGQGSWRVVSDASDAMAAVHGLLSDIERPRMRNVKIDIRGLETAATYPQTLPNLPAGRQHIIVGRHNPLVMSNPTVSVKGEDAGEPFNYSVNLPIDAATDNSFVPRFWARHHMDGLMALGRDPQTKAKVIALSEDFQIISPFTSLLVLEDDALRERFKVEKRLRMRDGEEFFAQGRENAAYELQRQQILAARAWRVGLRAEVIEWLKSMGRGLSRDLDPLGTHVWSPVARGGYSYSPIGDASLNPMMFTMYPNAESLDVDGIAMKTGGVGGGGGRRMSDGEVAKSTESPPSPSARPAGGESWGDDKSEGGPASFGGDEANESDSDEELAESPNEDAYDGPSDSNSSRELLEKRFEYESNSLSMRRKSGYDDGSMNYSDDGYSRFGTGFGVRNRILPSGRWPWEPRPEQLLERLFPSLPRPRQPQMPTQWPVDVAELANSLNVMPTPDSLKASGMSISVTSTDIEQRDGDRGSTITRWILADGEWASVSESPTSQSKHHSWATATTRGSWSNEWDLARIRPVENGDARDWPQIPDVVGGRILNALWGFNAKLETTDTKRMLVITTQFDSGYRREVDIHLTLPQVLEIREFHGDKRAVLHTFGAYTEIAGQYWPTEVTTTFDHADAPVTRLTIAVSRIANADAKATIAQIATPNATTLTLGELPKRLAESKAGVASDTPTPEQAWQLLLHYASSQQWGRAKPAADAVLAWASGKPGEPRIRIALYSLQRQNELALDVLNRLATELAATPSPTDLLRAERIQSLGNSILGSSEQLALFRTLFPVYERHYDKPQVERNTLNRYRHLLRGVSDTDAAHDVLTMMLTKWPEDFDLRLEVAQKLQNDGELDKALAYVRAMRAEGDKHTKQALFRLLGQEIGWLSDWGRWNEHNALVDAESDKPDATFSADHLNRTISYLIMQDRVDEADKRIADWLTLDDFADTKASAEGKRMAAVYHALGSGWNLRRNTTDQRWYHELLSLVRKAMISDQGATTLSSILNNWNFRSSPQGVIAQNEIWTYIKTHFADIPSARLSSLINTLRSHGYTPDDEDKPWEALANRIITRWEAAEFYADQDNLSRLVKSIGTQPQRLRLARLNHQRRTDPTLRLQTAVDLMTEIRSSEWDDGFASEHLALIVEYGEIVKQVGYPDYLLNRAVDSQIQYIHTFVAWAVSARSRTAELATDDHGKLPRRQLIALRNRLVKEARQATHEQLNALLPKYKDHLLSPWIELEILELGYHLKHEPQLLFNTAHAIAKPLADRAVAGDELDWPARDRVMLGRTLTMLSWFAFDTPKVPDLAQVLRPLLDKASTHTRGSIGRTSLVNWLIAADDGEGLRRVLSGWFGDGTNLETTPWGRVLAQIQAEQNMLAEAIHTMRSVADVDDLSSQEWSMLSNWLMAIDDKPGFNAARIESHQTRSEWEIESSVQSESWSFGRGSSMEVTEDLIDRIRIMVTKSSQPSSRMWAINRIYSHTKDFRILQAIANAIPGQTPSRVYDLVRSLMPIIRGIDEEATFDRLYAELARIKQQYTSPTDRRAMNLLTCLTAGRAYELSGTAADNNRALQALDEAFKRDWLPGERYQYAYLLAQMGKSNMDSLNDMQFNQLGLLYQGAARGSGEALYIASQIAALHQTTSRISPSDPVGAIKAFTPALAAYRQDRGDLLPTEAEWALRNLSGYYIAANEYAHAERIWREELAKPYPARRRWSYEKEITDIWLKAFQNRQGVTVGSNSLKHDIEIFKAATAWLTDAMFEQSAEDRVLQTRLQTFVNFHRVSRDARHLSSIDLAFIQESLRSFAYSKLPRFLDQTHGRLTETAVSSISSAIHSQIGAAEALTFLVVRAENERAWLARFGRDFWSRHAWNVARWRRDAGVLPSDIDSRLARIVGEELRRDLSTGQERNRSIYVRGNTFWAAKLDLFKATALDVASSVKDDETLTLHIAEYLFNGLQEYDAAIGLLVPALQSGSLSYDGRNTLASYYEHRNRHIDALQILLDLLGKRPSDFNVRTRLIATYVALDQPAKALAMTKTAEAWLKENKSWHPWQIVNLVEGISGPKATEPMLIAAEAYFTEAITMTFTGRRNRWAPDWSLGQWHQSVAKLRSRLGKTIEAIDAASAGIVLWGPWQEQRETAMRTLRDVIAKATDLTPVLAHIDATVASTGLENPILRKAVGNVLADRKQYPAAIAQFELALAVAPEDTELHELVIAAAESAKDYPLMAEKLRRLIAERPLETKPYLRLSKLLETHLNNPAEALRVATTLVEISPHEAFGQSAMAEWFIQRKRWDEANERFDQVIRINPNSPEGYLGKLKVLIRSGKSADAAAMAREIIAREWPDTVSDIEGRVKAVLADRPYVEEKSDPKSPRPANAPRPPRGR